MNRSGEMSKSDGTQALRDRDTFSLVGLAEPRIEPEIVFKLALAPAPGHGRDSIAGLHRLGRARFRNRAINLSWMGVFRARHGRGVRPARCPATWASSFNRSARRELEPDAFDLRNRSEARRHSRRSRSRYECVGWTCSALRHLVDILARDQVNPPLAAGEIVTTGTLTRALPRIERARHGRPNSRVLRSMASVFASLEFW